MDTNEASIEEMKKQSQVTKTRVDTLEKLNKGKHLFHAMRKIYIFISLMMQLL